MISVLIPWRSTDPDRVRAWDYNRACWERLDVQVCVADDGRESGPFSLARAVNRAREHATGDGLVVFGADHIPPPQAKLAWIADRLDTLPWTGVYAATRVFTSAATLRVLQGRPPALVAHQAQYISMQQGIIAVRSKVWDDVGGMDERFEGWGAEDTAFRVTLAALYPDGSGGGEGEAWSLWHPDLPREELTRANIARCTEYETAAREGRMREFLQEVRDDGSGDGD